jgi:hypothetical protein
MNLMRNWLKLLGVGLIFFGLLALVDNLFHIHIWNYLGPILLIALGVWILVKPANRPWWTWIAPASWNPPDAAEWTRTGNQREHHTFAGHTVLDLSHEDIPETGANYRFTGFAGEVDIFVPAGLGVKVHASYFAGTINFFGEEMTGVMAPVSDETPGFDLAPRKVYVEVVYFTGETHVISRG